MTNKASPLDEINLGSCPIIVKDEETAKLAGEWAQRQAAKALSDFVGGE